MGCFSPVCAHFLLIINNQLQNTKLGKLLSLRLDFRKSQCIKTKERSQRWIAPRHHRMRNFFAPSIVSIALKAQHSFYNPSLSSLYTAVFVSLTKNVSLKKENVSPLCRHDALGIILLDGQKVFCGQMSPCLSDFEENLKRSQ